MSTSTTEKQQLAKEPFNPLAIAKHLGTSTPRLDHLLRFLNSVRGTDKVLMVSKGQDNRQRVLTCRHITL